MPKPKDPNNPKEGGTTLFLRGLNEKLKRDFKVLCIKQGTTMHEKVVAMMRQEVENAKKNK